MRGGENGPDPHINGSMNTGPVDKGLTCISYLVEWQNLLRSVYMIGTGVGDIGRCFAEYVAFS